jgi:hypothetical protein
VLTSIPIYFLTAFAPKKWTVKRLDKIRRGFLWKGDESTSGGHCLVSWKNVKKPKKLGGLGVLDLELFGHALRLRWLWTYGSAGLTQIGRGWVLKCPAMKLTDSFSGQARLSV